MTASSAAAAGPSCPAAAAETTGADGAWLCAEPPGESYMKARDTARATLEALIRRRAATLLWRQTWKAHGTQTATITSISALSHRSWWLPEASHTWARQDAAVTMAQTREWTRVPVGRPPAPQRRSSATLPEAAR